ncbi:replication factor A protein [Trifolium repens]|nr:replication factor A protein [Trifolium repens]KAK2456865.1 replication factor A protein [Trifolium repens]
MLFGVDRSLNHGAVSDGSYRVKRVCMDPMIIEAFYSQGPFFTPSKTMSNAIYLDSNGSYDDIDAGDDFHRLSLLRSLL